MPAHRAGIPPPTVAEWSREAIRTLVAAGVPEDDARVDVAVLGRHALGWNRVQWVVETNHTLTTAERQALDAVIDRRATREPVAYILGEKEFFGRDFVVTPAVLIPRPETEHLVEAALDWLKHGVHVVSANRLAVDVGTGSGCVAITLALEIPDLRVIATDISPDALAIAGSNARRHDVHERITLMQHSLVPPLPGAADIVVSNPPYIALSDRSDLMPDVRDYEPAVALFGGEDGLAVLNPLIAAARQALKPGGLLAVEMGSSQAAAVQDRFQNEGFRDVRVIEDLGGRPRVVIGHRPAESV